MSTPATLSWATALRYTVQLKLEIWRAFAYCFRQVLMALQPPSAAGRQHISLPKPTTWNVWFCWLSERKLPWAQQTSTETRLSRLPRCGACHVDVTCQLSRGLRRCITTRKLLHIWRSSHTELCCKRTKPLENKQPRIAHITYRRGFERLLSSSIVPTKSAIALQQHQPTLTGCWRSCCLSTWLMSAASAPPTP